MVPKADKCLRRRFRREATRIPLQILLLLLKPPPSCAPLCKLPQPLVVQQRSITRSADHLTCLIQDDLNESQWLSCGWRGHAVYVWDWRLEVGQQPSFRPQACDLQGPAGPVRTLCPWRLPSDQRHPFVSSRSATAVSDLPAINTQSSLQILTAV